MADAPFEGAVVFTQRSDIASVIRAELKDLHVDPIFTPEGLERCIEDLISNSQAILALDWQVGVDSAFQVLEAVRRPLRATIRPVFLFSQNDHEGLDALAAEYGVVQIHIGSVTRNIIREKLAAIVRAEGFPNAVKDGLRLVAEARERGDWLKAQSILSDLRNQFPGNARIDVDFAQNCFELSDLKAATNAIMPHCKTDPADPRALNILGRIQLRQGLFEKATVTLQRAKLISPLNIERLINLGEAYLSINMIERAEKNFRAAVDLGSKDPKAIGGLGKSLLLGDRVNEGLVFLRQLSSNREMASVFNSSAVLIIRSGRFAEGMKLYHVAIDTVEKESPVLSKLAFNMGIGFIRKQDPESAARCFAIALKLDPDNHKAEKNLAFLEHRLQFLEEIPDDISGQLALLKSIKIDGGISGNSENTISADIPEAEEAS